MRMRNIAMILGSSILSALIAIVIYRQVAPPEKVIIRETVSPQYANFNDPLDGTIQRTFYLLLLPILLRRQKRSRRPWSISKPTKQEAPWSFGGPIVMAMLPAQG
jgi:hypothetical protein